MLDVVAISTDGKRSSRMQRTKAIFSQGRTDALLADDNAASCIGREGPNNATIEIGTSVTIRIVEINSQS